MKKVYTKPVLVMDDFTLSQSIAHNCGHNLYFNQATLKYKGSCGWDPAPNNGTDMDVYFMDGQNVCKLPTLDVEGACYNNPECGCYIFNS